jgi:anti-sigma factor RsiW
MTRGHLSAWEIDAWNLGMLSEETRRHLVAHDATCARCHESVEEARLSAAHFDAEVLPRTLAGLRRRTASPPRARRVVWALTLAAGFAAMSVIVVGSLRPRSTRVVSDDDAQVTVKGGPGLRVFARRTGQVFPVREGARLRNGDEVRFVAQPGSLPYLLIASVDGASKINIYYPYDGGQSGGPLTPETANELPDSIRLDATPGPERVFAFFSKAPLSSADVRSALADVATRGPSGIRDARAPSLPATTALTLLFEKDAL